MPATQQVVINITARGNTRQIREARRELLKLAAAGQLVNTTQTSLQKQFDKVDRRAKMLKRTFGGLGKMLSSLNKIALKLFTVGFAAGLAVLPLVNALFATGRVLINLYRNSMSLLAGVVAALGAALAGAAAAMREYTAAVQAYNFKASPTLNSRLYESRSALRGLQGDAVLASFGMQALNQAFANLSKSGQVNATSRNLLRGLADFAAAGGDPARNLAAAAEFVGLLQKAGKLDQKALAAAEQLGPTFVEALDKAKKKGATTLAELSKMIQSGELSVLGGVEGQAGIVGGTLLGRFRVVMTELQVMAADFGQSLLGPLKEGLASINRTIQRLFARVGPEMIAYGRGGLIGSLTGLIDTLANFSVKLFREYLPGVNGMMGRLASWWQKVLYWFNDFVDGLRSVLPLGSAVIEAFGKPFLAIFQTIGGWIQYVGETVKKNQALYNRFGNDLLKFIQKIQDLGKRFIDIFTEALPAIDRFLGFITTAVDRVMDLAGALGFVAEMLASVFQMGGQGIGAFTSMISLMLAGGFIRSTARNLRGGAPFQQALPYGIGARFANRGGATGPVAQANQMGGYGAAQYGPALPAPVPLTYQQVYANARSRGASVPGAAIIAQQQFGMRGPSGFTGYGRMINAYRMAGRYGGSRREAVYKALSRHVQSGGIVPGAKFSGAMSGFAPAALMGVGSMFAPAEAQASLMPGAAIASLAPMLGKFGPLAAFGGMAFGGIGAMMSARTAGGGAGMGALGGAGIGGAIGMLGGPVGMVIGSVLGATAGAVVGYFKGKSNADKLVAKKAAGEYMNEVYGEVSKDFLVGDTAGIRATLERVRADADRAAELAGIAEGSGRAVRRRLYGAELEAGRITQAEYDVLIAAPGTYRRELEKNAETMEGVLIPMLDRFDDTARIAEKSLGMTTDELMRLANETGVNLYDNTISLTDKLKQLGLAAQYTSEQIVGAIRDIQVNGVEKLQSGIERMFSGQAMDEMTEALYQQAIESGNVPLTDLSKYISDILNQFNIQDPNSPLMNVQRLLNTFGREGSIFKEGMQLEGLSFIFEPIFDLLEELGRTTQQGSAESLTDMIAKQALFAGIAVDRGQLSEILGTKSLGELDVIMKKLADGTLSVEQLIAGDRDVRGLRSRSMVSGAFGELGLGDLAYEKIDQSAMTLEQLTMLYGEEGAALLTGMNNVIEAAFTNKPDWMKTPPDWYSKESFQAILNADDTSTPRGVGDTVTSRLGRTMSRHNYFDSMFAGKRNVTSSFRNFGLGSINSDHVTGRAYDLVGDNLGSYATAVNRMGGFAEFHGAGGNRHLHVVPGETPVGDATAPYMSNSVSTLQSSPTTNNYSVVVNAAPGMDVNALANAVMDRIQRIERQNAERS